MRHETSTRRLNEKIRKMTTTNGKTKAEIKVKKILKSHEILFWWLTKCISCRPWIYLTNVAHVFDRDRCIMYILNHTYVINLSHIHTDTHTHTTFRFCENNVRCNVIVEQIAQSVNNSKWRTQRYKYSLKHYLNFSVCFFYFVAPFHTLVWISVMFLHQLCLVTYSLYLLLFPSLNPRSFSTFFLMSRVLSSFHSIVIVACSFVCRISNFLSFSLSLYFYSIVRIKIPYFIASKWKWKWKSCSQVTLYIIAISLLFNFTVSIIFNSSHGKTTF